jgi:hypothetical protein
LLNLSKVKEENDMRNFHWSIILFLSMIIGCATISTTPTTQIDPSWLVGTWKGHTSGVYGGSTGHGAARYGPHALLTIFDTSLRGTFTMTYTKGQSETFPFFGKIEDGMLVARWKGGRWMKLGMLEAKGKKILEGNFDFLKASGILSLIYSE